MMSTLAASNASFAQSSVPEAALEQIRGIELSRGKVSDVLPYLQSKTPKVRAAAARALARLRADPPALVETLRSERDEETVSWLLFALGQVAEGAPILSSFLSEHKPFETRSQTLELSAERLDAEKILALRALGRSASQGQVPLLNNLLNHENPRVRGEAAIALGLLLRRGGSVSPEIVTIAGEALKQRVASESNAEARWRLAWAFSSLAARAEARAGLLELLSLLSRPGEDEKTRAFAARALGALAPPNPALAPSAEAGEPSAAETPAALLSAAPESWTVATELARALARWPGENSTRALIAITGHNNFHARREALRALAARCPSGITDPLKADLRKVALRGLGDLWETARGEALVLLTRLGPEHAISALKTFASGDVTARRYASRAIVGCLDPALKAPLEATSILATLAKDPDPRVRLEVLDAITASLQGPNIADRADQVAGLLRQGINDPALSVCGTAVAGLAKLSPPDLVQVLTHIYERDRGIANRYELRELIVTTLAELLSGLTNEARGTALTTLRAALKDTVPAVARAAAKALAEKASEVHELPPLASPARPDFATPAKGQWLELETSRGLMLFELDFENAPLHLANLAHLITNKPSAQPGSKPHSFYDGLSFHRVVSHFVIQGGCPNGDGWGDPGWTIVDELSDRPFLRGTLGMPKAGDDTGGCQLFVTHGPTPHLDGKYTAFGQLRVGFEVLDRIEEGDRILSARLVMPPASR
jgi:cyclophilin family peptidyl-prolyl cis-trans isomerase/HEAT repeat protein